MFLLVSAVQQCKSAISVYICIPYVLIYISHMYINIYPICAYIYICLPSPVSLPSSHHLHPSPAGRHSVWSWAPCVTQRLPLALYFTYGSVYMSVLLSQIFFFQDSFRFKIDRKVHKWLICPWPHPGSLPHFQYPLLDKHMYFKNIISSQHLY